MVINIRNFFDDLGMRALTLYRGENSVASLIKFMPLSETASAICIITIIYFFKKIYDYKY